MMRTDSVVHQNAAGPRRGRFRARDLGRGAYHTPDGGRAAAPIRSIQSAGVGRMWSRRLIL